MNRWGQILLIGWFGSVAYAGPDEGQQTPSVEDAVDAPPLTEPAPNVDVEADIAAQKQDSPTDIEPSTQASDPSVPQWSPRILRKAKQKMTILFAMKWEQPHLER